jgi:Flp pilus assembly protein TadD
LEKKGEYDKALKDYSEAIRLNPKDARAYNNIASLQATCSGQHIRDGQKAIQNANKAYELSGGKEWQPLSTLAAAYAESGNFGKAVEWEMKAIEMAKNDKSVAAKDIEDERSFLELYKHGKPNHEEPKKK